jgi:peptidoglycan/xylan/chitin deacetylase (PgdA/CDA1 family)
MYHRIAAPRCDPWGLAVSPSNFSAQLDQFKRARTVLTTDDFVQRMKESRLPRDALAITFDDGYLDNLTDAAPFLEEFGLPATLFLATGPTKSQQPFWYDELAVMLLDAQSPVDVTLELHSGPHRISFGEREERDNDKRNYRAWEPRTRRETTYYETWQRLRALRPVRRDEAMVQLRAVLPTEVAPGDRPMTEMEVRRLAASQSFSLGGHTVDHPDLLELSDQEALDEMVRGKQEVERLTGARIAGFAYPHGRNDERIRALAAKAGFGWACTTDGRFVSSRLNPFAVPRIAAQNRPDTVFLA